MALLLTGYLPSFLQRIQWPPFKDIEAGWGLTAGGSNPTPSSLSKLERATRGNWGKLPQKSFDRFHRSNTEVVRNTKNVGDHHDDIDPFTLIEDGDEIQIRFSTCSALFRCYRFPSIFSGPTPALYRCRNYLCSEFGISAQGHKSGYSNFRELTTRNVGWFPIKRCTERLARLRRFFGLSLPS